MNLISHYAFNERGDVTKARQFEAVEQIKEFLKSRYNGGYAFGSNNLVKSGSYKEAAIAYDFRPYLTKYLIEYSYGHLQSAWAPSKGALRKALCLSRNDRVLVYPAE